MEFLRHNSKPTTYTTYIPVKKLEAITCVDDKCPKFLYAVCNIIALMVFIFFTARWVVRDGVSSQDITFYSHKQPNAL